MSMCLHSRNDCACIYTVMLCKLVIIVLTKIHETSTHPGVVILYIDTGEKNKKRRLRIFSLPGIYQTQYGPT